MKLKFALAILLLTAAAAGRAQSKVFKEVSSEISSQMKPIMQDDALIGYLVFTQLEKANKDSFNYQVSIMDENLNDIGKVDFREKNLQLHDVSFDQDVLCMVYLKSDIADLKAVSVKEIKNSVDDGKHAILTQLINLDGKIIYSGSRKVDLTLRNDAKMLKKYASSNTMVGYLKHPVMLKNIPGKGFALFYGDDNKNRIVAFDFNGKDLWEKSVAEANNYLMLTTTTELYLLSKKKNEMVNGGYEVISYNVNEGKTYDTYKLKDKNGNQLQVMGFQLDPSKGKPVITGLIINQRRGNQVYKPKQLKHGPYDGVFTIVMNGPQKSQIKEKFSYWRDGSQAPDITKSGNFTGKETPDYTSTVRDFKGNTYFVGRGFTRKLRVGAIVASVITIPLVFPPIYIMGISGTHKMKYTDAFLLRQDSLGRLSNTSTIELESLGYQSMYAWTDASSTISTYTVTNTASKNNFLIIADRSNTIIYNVDTRKIVRKVPRYESKTVTNIYPAKEGHIMVMEYNRTARETKLSIEALR